MTLYLDRIGGHKMPLPCEDSTGGKRIRALIKQFYLASQDRIYNILDRFENDYDRNRIIKFFAVATELQRLGDGGEIFERHWKSNFEQRVANHTVIYAVSDEEIKSMYSELGIESFYDYKQIESSTRGLIYLVVSPNRSCLQLAEKKPADVFVFHQFYFIGNGGPYPLGESPYPCPCNGILGVYKKNNGGINQLIRAVQAYDLPD